MPDIVARAWATGGSEAGGWLLLSERGRARGVGAGQVHTRPAALSSSKCLDREPWGPAGAV